MKNTLAISILTASLSTLVATTAHAAVFTFGAGDNNLSTITKTVDGITLTVSNPAPDGAFSADSDGLAVLSVGFFATITSFDLTFSSPVQLIGYNVGFVEVLDGNESLTLTAGSSTSLESSPFVVGSRNFANQFNVVANQTISVTAGGVDPGDLIQFLSITANPVNVPTAVPEPSSLMALGVVGLGLFGLKKKSKG